MGKSADPFTGVQIRRTERQHWSDFDGSTGFPVRFNLIARKREAYWRGHVLDAERDVTTIAGQDRTYSTFSNPVSIVTLVPMILPWR